jgi:hypothetical protein
MKRIIKWVLRIIEVIVVVYVIFVTSLILFRNKYNYTQFDDKTLLTVNKDNINLLKNGAKNKDLLIIKQDISKIKEGSLIYYYEANDSKYIVKTGIVSSLTKDDTQAVYVLEDKDKTTVASSRVMGMYYERKANLGGVLDFLESRVGFLIFVLLPILVIFIYQIYDLVVSLKYDDKKEVRVEHVEPAKIVEEQQPVSTPEEEEKVTEPPTEPPQEEAPATPIEEEKTSVETKVEEHPQEESSDDDLEVL